MKMVKFLSGGVALVSFLLTLSSCEGFDLNGFLNGEDQDDEENIGGGDFDDILPEERPGTATLLSPSEQKLKLDSVGRKILEKCPSEDVEDLFQLYDAFENAYIDNDSYSFDAIMDFGEKAFDDSYTETDEYYYDAAKKQYLNDYALNVVVALSNHNGEFAFEPDSVSRDRNSTYEGVKVDIPLRNKNYQVTLTTSGKKTTAFYRYKSDSEYKGNSGYWDNEKGEYVYVDGGVTEIYKRDVRFTIEVPENIDLSITEDGAPYATVSIRTAQSFTQTGLNPSVDNFNYDVTVFLNNGYEVIAQNVTYDGAKGEAGAGVIIKKDGEPLVTAVAAGKASVENCTESYEDEYWKDEYTSIKVNYAKDFNILLDIIGEVQIKGTCSDAKELYEAYDAFEEATSYWDWETDDRKNPDRETIARHVNNINAKLDLNLYYDLDYTKRQAYVEFELDTYDAGWDVNGDGTHNYDDVEYGLRPVIVFNDNSRYAFAEYFTEEAFELLLEQVDGFADGYADLFDRYIGIEKEVEEVQPSIEYPAAK